MDFERRIAGMCLYGLIHREQEKDRLQCMKTIRHRYGTKVSRIVNGYFKKTGPPSQHT